MKVWLLAFVIFALSVSAIVGVASFGIMYPRLFALIMLSIFPILIIVSIFHACYIGAEQLLKKRNKHV